MPDASGRLRGCRQVKRPEVHGLSVPARVGRSAKRPPTGGRPTGGLEAWGHVRPGGRGKAAGRSCKARCHMSRSEWLANGAKPGRRSPDDARDRTRTHAQALQDPAADPWRSEVAVLGRRAALRSRAGSDDDLEAADARLLRCHKAGRQEVPSRVGWEPGRLPAAGLDSEARRATMRQACFGSRARGPGDKAGRAAGSEAGQLAGRVGG